MSGRKDSESLLPIVLERDPTQSVVTSYAGLLPYFDLWKRLRMPEAIDALVHVCGDRG
jgi:hypothetical protein